MIRTIDSWIKCKKFISCIKDNNTSYIIGHGLQKYMIKSKKLELINKQTKKLCSDFLTKEEIDINPCDNIKKLIRNHDKFKKWIDINLIFKNEDLIENNFLEIIFKSKSTSISSYQADNIMEIYFSKYKKNISSDIENQKIYSYKNIREHYNYNVLLTNGIIPHYENEIFEIYSSSIIIGYENLINDKFFKYKFNNRFESLFKIYADKYSDKYFEKCYIFLNEKDVGNIYIPNTNVINVLTYPEHMNINDVFHLLKEM